MEGQTVYLQNEDGRSGMVMSEVADEERNVGMMRSRC